MLYVFSRRIVRRCMRTTLHARLVLDALDMAAVQRHATDVVHQSDQGSQYHAFAFGQRCKLRGVQPLMGSRGYACEYAMAASFFATPEVESLAKHWVATHPEERLTFFRYIEGWRNPHRRRSALGQRSPLAFEPAHAVQSEAA